MDKKDSTTKRPLYFFLHIPKTGGTTINHGLASTYKNGEVIFLTKDFLGKKTSRKDVEFYLNSIPDDQKKKIKVIAGHDVYYGLHEIFTDREPRYIACFRHPTDLIISNFNYYKTFLNKNNIDLTGISQQVIQDVKTLTFEEILAKYSTTSNHSFKFLTFRLLENNNTINENNRFTDERKNLLMLEKIKKILSHFYFLGITEKSKDDFLFIADCLGITKYLTTENISTKYFSIIDNPSIENNIKKYNILDQNLYKYALEINGNFKYKNADFYLRTKKIRLKLAFSLFISMLDISQYPQNIYYFSNFLKQKSHSYKKILKYFKNLN